MPDLYQHKESGMLHTYPWRLDWYKKEEWINLSQKRKNK